MMIQECYFNKVEPVIESVDIINPSFSEDDVAVVPNGWSGSGGYTYTGSGHDGDGHCLLLTSQRDDIRQTCQISGGQTYHFSCWTMAQSIGSFHKYFTVKLDFDKGTTITRNRQTSKDYDWVEVAFDFTTEPGCKEMTIIFTGEDFRVDDVSCVLSRGYAVLSVYGEMNGEPDRTKTKGDRS